MRKAAVVLAVLFLVIVLAIVLVPRLVSIDALRPRIVAALEEKTGRTVALDRISLSLFPGIGVRIAGLSVSGDARHPDERLLEVPEGEVRLAIGPLFSGRAEFTKFVLRRPRILFRKYADGTHSATRIAARLARKEEKPGVAAPAADSGDKVSIAIRSVSIEEADLSLRIEQPEGGETRWDVSPFTFRLGGIGGSENEFEIGARIEGAVRGEVSFAGTVSIERRADSGPARFDLAGRGKLFGQKVEVTGKMPAPAGPAEVDLRMAYLDADALFPPRERGAKAPGKRKENGGKPRGGGGETPLSIRVHLAIDAGKARGLEFEDLRGTARYEQGTLFLDSVRARLYGGEAVVTGRVALDAPSPDFRAKFDLKGLEAGEILSRKTSLGRLVSGPVTLAADLSGGMGDSSEFLRTVSGSGSIRISGGKIKKIDLLGSATGLAGLSNLLPGLPVARGSENEKITPFNELSADFRIAGGRIQTDALRIVSDRMGLSGNASVGFDRTIDFRGILRLSNDLSGKVGQGAGKFLRGRNGEVEIPLVLSGPLTGPAMAIDAETLARGLAGGLLRGIAESLAPPPEPVPSDNAGKGPPAGTTGTPGPREEFEGLLRKLLPGTR